tara:strand:+ start:1012 stop:1776 length:765 start_codon:yes stop_codon:yes gene_type:complete
MQLPTMPSFSLKGRSALVVGASSGIGTACAVALAEHGAKVTVAARRKEKLQILVNQMKKRNYEVQILVMDINNVEETKEIISSHSSYDILVNSAGIAKHSAAKDTVLDDYDIVMNTNLRGAYFLTQSVSKKLISSKKPGSLINISSQMGLVGGQERAVYCASKHAVEGFTKSMAIELGVHNIRVNTICPTFILTEMTQKTFEVPEKRNWIENKIKIGRIGKVEDIMGAVVYLASDASSLVTGSSLLVDGGWTAG